MSLRFLRRKRRGANAIEFALTLPIFLTVTFGMMEYGWYFAKQAQVNGALAQACRDGSIIDPINPPSHLGGCSGDACITDEVEALLVARINGANLSCADCSASVSGLAPERVVNCRAEVDYLDITGLLPVLPDKIITESQVRLEWQRVSF